eukprot:1438-Heterococcus_DN1.PRE.2
MHVQANTQRLGAQVQAGAKITTMQQQQQSLHQPVVATSSLNMMATSAPVAAAARLTAPTAPATSLYNAAVRQPLAAPTSAATVAAHHSATSSPVDTASPVGFAVTTAAGAAATAAGSVSIAAVSKPPQQARAGARRPAPTELITVPETVALELVPVSPKVSVHIAGLTGLKPSLRLNAATNKRLALVYN